MKLINESELASVSGGNPLAIAAVVVVAAAVTAVVVYSAGYGMGYSANHLDGECHGG
jgi:lactobin A/cerein 7B family class IIb bacteriocin